MLWRIEDLQIRNLQVVCTLQVHSILLKSPAVEQYLAFPSYTASSFEVQAEQRRYTGRIIFLIVESSVETKMLNPRTDSSLPIQIRVEHRHWFPLMPRGQGLGIPRYAKRPREPSGFQNAKAPVTPVTCGRRKHPCAIDFIAHIGTTQNVSGGL